MSDGQTAAAEEFEDLQENFEVGELVSYINGLGEILEFSRSSGMALVRNLKSGIWTYELYLDKADPVEIVRWRATGKK